MGRKRSQFICPKCKKQGYLRRKSTRNGKYSNAKSNQYYYVAHYDSNTKRISTCYIDNILSNNVYQNNLQKHDLKTIDLMKIDNYALEDIIPLKTIFDKTQYKNLDPEEKIEVYHKITQRYRQIRRLMHENKKMMEVICKQEKVNVSKSPNFTSGYPPQSYWGESEVYHKIGDLSRRFYRMGRHLEKIQKLVYRFKPDENLSKQCTKDLDLFEKELLIPLEKLFIPISDERWSSYWPEWIRIQIDNLNHGPRASGMKNSVETGEFERKRYKEKLLAKPIKREMTSSQVKKKQLEVLKTADEFLKLFPLSRALNDLFTKIEIRVDTREYNPK